MRIAPRRIPPRRPSRAFLLAAMTVAAIATGLALLPAPGPGVARISSRLPPEGRSSPLVFTSSPLSPRTPSRDENPAGGMSPMTPELGDEISFQTALRRWLETDPAAALAWLETREDLSDVSDLVDATVLAWSKGDPLAACACLRERPAGALRDRLLARALLGLADYDPRLAGDYARAWMPAGEARRFALEGVATSWAKDDPAAAAGWAREIEQAGEPEIAGLVLYPWFSEARREVADWVRALPPSSERDRLLARVIGWQLEKNPEEAEELIGAISDPKLRSSMTRAWVLQWWEGDSARAAAWVRSLSAPDMRGLLLAALHARSAGTEDFRR